MKYLIILSLFFVSCEREKAEPLTWYLSLGIPALSYSGILPVQTISENRGAGNTKVGLCLDFSDERLKCRVFTEARITQATGIVDRHAFVLVNDSLNICNGLQRVFVNLKLANR